MPMTRNEVGQMREVALELAAERLRDALAADWRRGEPGKLSDVYDLALIYSECAVRGLPLPQPIFPDQLELDREAFFGTRSRPLH